MMLHASGCSSSSSSSSCPSSSPRLCLWSPANNESHVDGLKMSPGLSCHCSSSFLQLVLEKSLQDRSDASRPSNGTPMQKSAAELVTEIAALEVEVMILEHNLLSLYRKAFKYHPATLPSAVMDKGSQSPLPCKTGSLVNLTNLSGGHKDTDMQRGTHASTEKDQTSHDPDDSDYQSYHSFSKFTSRRDLKRNTSSHRSLANLLCVSLTDVPESPDRLSEDIIKCISSIFCKLANPQLPHIGYSASPSSSLSFSSTLSPQDFCDIWSTRCSEDASSNPCQFEELKEKSDPYKEMVEVLRISVDDDNFNYAATMLQKFRSLVGRLEKVDPKEMKREEKLAFWINIHNSLLMHAYLAYGIHHNRIKSSSSVLKAAYNVGGHSINSDVIQSSILGCQPHRSAPWLHTLFSPGAKFNTGSNGHVFALDYPEPLVHFALCSGAYSDPAVRVYKASSVFQDLKLAKEEYIQASTYIHNNTKIILPKLLYYYAKDASLDLPGLLEIVHACVSKTQEKAIQEFIKGRRLDKHIQWAPQNSAIRYIIHRELAQG
ncbi:uncharacterized protein LOC122072847 isoform X2 [Macadamia integrifolia]|uniref:uncharacterized protein LOC122072847 isoform X2 n=1 Tax=Macadamia integrifolia TaxID=60698 RepID=UPI001C4FF365|nr:uncharacterized protein LOC122072847 isoform X2 [Macadamia integrifolia]